MISIKTINYYAMVYITMNLPKNVIAEKNDLSIL